MLSSVVVARAAATQLGRGDVAAAMVTVPAVVAAVVVVARLALWALVWGPPRRRRTDPAVRAAAEAALADTEIAVLCDDRSLVLVRTAAIAATAALGAPSRVMLVGADPRLESVGRSLSVRVVPAGRGTAPAIAAAVAAARRDHLLITDAGRAVLPGAVRSALELLDADTAWVQADATVPHLRTLHDHVRRRVGWASLDARDAMPWWGSDSIVRVAAMRELPLARGVAACTIAAQRRGWVGRWHDAAICVEQTDGDPDPHAAATARADRLRRWRSVGSPLWTPGLRLRQRLGHAAMLADDLIGAAAAAAVIALVTAAVATAATAEVPVSVGGWAWGAAASIVLAWCARWWISDGLVRPFASVRAGFEDLVPSVRALVWSLRPADRSPIGAATIGVAAARRTRRVVLATVVTVDLAVVAAACRLATAPAGGADPTTTGLSTTDRVVGATALTVAGIVVVSGLLAAARVVRRNQSVRAERRLPAAVAARIGSYRGQVLDLAASGFRAEFSAPAALLSEVPVRLDARGLAPIAVRAQVVRVEPRGDRWVLGLRLVTSGANDHDEYLALWLAQMVGAAEQRPKRRHDPVVGRWPVASGGVPVVRVLSAAAMLLLGVAVLPSATAGASRADTVDGDAVTATSSAPTTAAGVADDADDPDGAPAESVDVEGPDGSVDTGDLGVDADPADPADPAGSVLSAGEGTDPGDADSGAPTMRPSATRGGLTLVSSIDDLDRQVEGAQVVAHVVTIHHDDGGPDPVSHATVTVVAGGGAVVDGSIGGTCDGADTAVLDTASSTTLEWRLFDTTELAPGEGCTLQWSEQLPASVELADGVVLRSEITVDRVARGASDGGDGASGVEGPSVVDEVVVRRPTLQVSTTAGDGLLDRLSIGAPMVWHTTVANTSPHPASAHGIDLVQTLPPNWTYTATVSVEPARCDGAPVVLVDEAAGRQTITWTDLCTLAQGERLELVFTATPGEAAAETPGLVDDAGERVPHVSDVALTAEDGGGTSLGRATDRASVWAQAVDLSLRLTDTGIDDAPADASPAVVVGGLGRYRIDVGNDGPDPTVGQIAVDLVLPAGFVVFSSSGDGWTCPAPADGAPLTCTTDTVLAVGAVLPPILVAVAVGPDALAVAVDPADRAVVEASATVRSGAVDVDPGDDTEREETLVRRDLADAEPVVVSLVAITGARRVDVGDRVAYDAVVTSQGSATITQGVEVRAELPPGLHIADVADIDAPGWTCDLSAGTSDSGGTWTCTHPGPIDPGAVLPPLRVRATVGAEALSSLAPSAEVELEQRLSAHAIGAAVVGRSATVTWTPVPATRNAVVIADRGGSWRTGEPHPIRLSATTEGPSGEYGPLTVELPLADGARVVGVDDGDWACRQGDTADGATTVVCSLDRRGVDYGAALLEPGVASTPIELLVVPGDTAALELRPRVRGATDPTWRTTDVEVAVIRPSELALDLDVTMPAAGAAVERGATIELTATVDNAGPATAEGVDVVLAVPEGWRLVPGDPGSGWRCVHDAAITCTLDTPLDVGFTASVPVVFALPADAPLGEATITAVVGATEDADLDGRTATVALDVVSTSDADTPASTGPAAGGTVDVPTTSPSAVPTTGGSTGSTGSTGTPAPPTESAAPLARLAGFGGTASAFVFALVLLSGRRRQGW